MIYFYDEVVSDGTTTTSTAHYMGSTNGVPSLIANPSLCAFVKGASSNCQVTLQGAVIPTLRDQSIQPVDSDYITVSAFTSNQVITIPSLNGVWVRYQIVNTSGSDATITCLLE